jgi:hypothetical protein
VAVNSEIVNKQTRSTWTARLIRLILSGLSAGLITGWLVSAALTIGLLKNTVHNLWDLPGALLGALGIFLMSSVYGLTAGIAAIIIACVPALLLIELSERFEIRSRLFTISCTAALGLAIGLPLVFQARDLLTWMVIPSLLFMGGVVAGESYWRLANGRKWLALRPIVRDGGGG